MNRYLPYVAWMTTVILAVVGYSISYGQVQKTVENTALAVVKNEEKIEKVDNKIQTVAEIAQESNAVNREQTVILQTIREEQKQTSQVLDKLVEKVYQD